MTRLFDPNSRLDQDHRELSRRKPRRNGEKDERILIPASRDKDAKGEEEEYAHGWLRSTTDGESVELGLKADFSPFANCDKVRDKACDEVCSIECRAGLR